MLCCSLLVALLAQPLALLTGLRARFAGAGARSLLASRSGLALGSVVFVAELALLWAGASAVGVVRLGGVEAGAQLPLHICKAIAAGLP